MSQLPSGAVTFLFSDVEGSTRLLKQLRDRYGEVLADHGRLLGEAFGRHGGRVVDTQGDSFFVAFTNARDAVLAAVEAQRSLAVHQWPDGAEVRVRMGIHTGQAAATEDRYHGLAVHRAARIAAAGQGGQILVSQTTHNLLEDEEQELPGIELRDLGEQRLKDLDRPVRLFQVAAGGLSADFPTRTSLRVVIAEDSVLLREGLAKLLGEAGLEVVGQAANADDLLLKVRSYKPDVAIVDVRMPPTHTDEGVRAAEVIREEHPEVGVLVLSQIVEAKRALRLFGEAPAGLGYLLKDRVMHVEDFVEAVRRVADGGTALDPEVVSQLLGRHRPSDPVNELTDREREVLSLMAEGRSNQGIGRTLFMSPKTVEAHIHRIFMKLGLEAAPDAHRRVLAVLAYLKQQ